MATEKWANSQELKIKPERLVIGVFNAGKTVKFPEPRLASEVICPRCGGDSGFLIPSENAWSCLNGDCLKYNCGPQKEEIKYQQPTSLLQYGVPAAYVSWKLDKCDQKKEIVDHLKAFAKDCKGNLIFGGKPGTGKTTAACAIISAFVDSGKDDCKFISFSRLNAEWKEHLATYANDCALSKQYANYQLLVLDDLGTRTPTDAFLDFLYLLIENRLSSYRGTVITTNMTSIDLRDKFGEAIFSRIMSGKAFRFEGNDKRIEHHF